jgi:hypothetical protein
MSELTANRLGLSRRRFLPLMSVLPMLSACSRETATIRFRVIAKVEVDGKPVEGSTVMQITYSQVTHSLIGSGGSTSTRAEALILELPKHGAVFILPFEHNDYGSLRQIYEHGLLECLRIGKGVGALGAADYARLRSAKGRIPYDHRYPAMVAFTNEADNRSLYEVKPESLGDWFPGVKFIGMDLEFTDAPLTHKLRDRLKWLSRPHGRENWDRDPPGPAHASPLSSGDRHLT